MPACRQCGKDNPEGTVFCGYCATPLARPGNNPSSPPPPKPTGNPVPPPSTRSSSPPPKASPPPNPFKPEIRTPIIHSAQSPPPPPIDFGGNNAKAKTSGSGGFELIPWSELSPGQRAGRVIVAVVALLVVLFAIRLILHNLGGGSTGSNANAPAAQSSAAPITDADRSAAIMSLCKVFQIYGLPKNDSDATEDARNAGELGGNQSPERSAYILNSVVGEFRGGKLGQSDCSDAGEPLPTNEETPDNSTPDVQRDNGQP
jgi:hypothetical protein